VVDIPLKRGTKRSRLNERMETSILGTPASLLREVDKPGLTEGAVLKKHK